MKPHTTAQHGPDGRHRRLRSDLATWSIAATALGGLAVLVVTVLGPDSDSIDRRAYLDGYTAAKQSRIQARNTADDAVAVGRACSNLAGRAVTQSWYDGCTDAVTGRKSAY